MRKKNPLCGRRYTITLFFDPEPFPAVFHHCYTDLFGNHYTNLFMDDSGRIYEIARVRQWE